MNRVSLASPGFQGRPWGTGGSRIVVTPTTPSLGVHTVAFDSIGVLNDPLVTPSVAPQTGSMLIACVGRGDLANFTGLTGATPHDNRGNPNYTQVGSVEAFSPPNNASGTALYKLPNAAGGSGYQVSLAQGLNGGSNNDEVTIFLVEVAGGTVVQDFSWLEDVTAHPTPSSTVTTTGPALLIAFWFGEGTSTSSISPDSGFTLLESQLLSASSIQGALATKVVSTPGTYGVTWTASPAQGAQMWMVAVQ